MFNQNNNAKPFLKWAGGKSQVINDIESAFPTTVKSGGFSYIEPFVGSGAVLFWLINNYTNINKIVINDINTDLINTYNTIKQNVDKLIVILEKYQSEYHSLADNPEQQKEYYYAKRELFNSRSSEVTIQSALFIFLNKTCFNGLFRVNKSNGFNVPQGSYKKPLICDDKNLRKVAVALQKVIILNGDYTDTLKYVNPQENTLYYLDPPYKPLSETSSFNSYSHKNFDDSEQVRLKLFCDELDKRDIDWILSNSDVRGKDSNNHFFDDLYKNYNIDRIMAKRSINANPEKRGKLTELLINNIGSC